MRLANNSRNARARTRTRTRAYSTGAGNGAAAGNDVSPPARAVGPVEKARVIMEWTHAADAWSAAGRAGERPQECSGEQRNMQRSPAERAHRVAFISLVVIVGPASGSWVQDTRSSEQCP